MFISKKKLSKEMLLEVASKEQKLIGSPVKVYRAMSEKKSSFGSKSAQPLLIMNPSEKMSETMQHMDFLRDVVDGLKIRPKCKDCIKHKENIKYWSHFITFNCLFIGKSTDKFMFDNFVQQLAKQKDDRAFKDMLMTLISLENDNHLLILWSSEIKNIKESLEDFATSKYSSKPEIGWRVYDENFYNSNFWESGNFAINHKPTSTTIFQRKNATFKKIMIQNRGQDSRTGLLFRSGELKTYELGNSLKKKTFKVISTEGLENLSYLCNFDSIGLNEYPIDEVHSDGSFHTELCIFKTREYDLKTLVNDFTSVLKYEKMHTCSGCLDFMKGNMFYRTKGEIISETEYFKAKARLQNDALIFNDHQGIFGDESLQKDGFTKHFGSGPMKYFRLNRLKTTSKTITFVPIKQND